VQLKLANVLGCRRFGERLRNVANRLQLWMWLLCVWLPSLRALRTLADLEKRKLVKRSPSANDARGILVETTREGNRVAEAIIPHAIAVQNSALRDLSADEIEFLIRLLKRIHRSVGSTSASTS
jgi:hypothetical protein